mmetsp:Transcript_34028/g.82890  ORF Transcript_34028/g.82890 Transcript_34028/m.82890 type:complete len:254 (-) Transcript_34028:10-771(-)
MSKEELFRPERTPSPSVPDGTVTSGSPKLSKSSRVQAPPRSQGEKTAALPGVIPGACCSRDQFPTMGRGCTTPFSEVCRGDTISRGTGCSARTLSESRMVARSWPKTLEAAPKRHTAAPGRKAPVVVTISQVVIGSRKLLPASNAAGTTVDDWRSGSSCDIDAMEMTDSDSHSFTSSKPATRCRSSADEAPTLLRTRQSTSTFFNCCHALSHWNKKAMTTLWTAGAMTTNKCSEIRMPARTVCSCLSSSPRIS